MNNGLWYELSKSAFTTASVYFVDENGNLRRGADNPPPQISMGERGVVLGGGFLGGVLGGAAGMGTAALLEKAHVPSSVTAHVIPGMLAGGMSLGADAAFSAVNPANSPIAVTLPDSLGRAAVTGTLVGTGLTALSKLSPAVKNPIARRMLDLTGLGATLMGSPVIAAKIFPYASTLDSGEVKSAGIGSAIAGAAKSVSNAVTGAAKSAWNSSPKSIANKITGSNYATVGNAKISDAAKNIGDKFSGMGAKTVGDFFSNTVANHAGKVNVGLHTAGALGTAYGASKMFGGNESSGAPQAQQFQSPYQSNIGG